MDEARSAREAVSIGVVGNCARSCRAARARVRAGPGDRPDERARPAGRVRTGGLTPDEAARLRWDDPAGYERRSFDSMARHVEAMVGFLDLARWCSTTGTTCGPVPRPVGSLTSAPTPTRGSCRRSCGRCSARASSPWAALSGDPEDISKTDRAVAELFPENERLHRWLEMAEERVAFQGLPARICWLGFGERARAGLRFNEMVASASSAPIVIGRDHLDSGSVASPYRETEAMRDGSDAIADWPILNALVNTAAGAHWVSVHHGAAWGSATRSTRGWSSWPMGARTRPRGSNAS